MILRRTPRFFGIFITGVAYVLACAIQKRFKASIFEPAARLLRDSHHLHARQRHRLQRLTYVWQSRKPTAYDGTGAISSRTCSPPPPFAIPLYEKLVYPPVAIIGGILAGMFACLGGVLVLSMAFGLDHTQYVTLLPKSITTAIGMGLSEELRRHGVRHRRVHHRDGSLRQRRGGRHLQAVPHQAPVAIGVSCGTGAHAMGTSRAREFGEIEEAMSGLSIAVCGLF